MDKTTTLTIRIKEDLKQQIKMNAVISNMTAKDYITELVIADTERLENKYGKKTKIMD